MDPRKLKALEGAVAGIRREYGQQAVPQVKNDDQIIIPHVGTGSLALDIAFGIGGFARSHIHEVWGGPDSGKTSIALLTIAHAQRRGGSCAYINADGLLDLKWAQKLGVDLDKLILISPDTGEMSFNIAERLIATGALDVLIIDSVAAMVPQAELNGDYGAEEREYLHAKMMSYGLRRLNTYVKRSHTACIFTNQVRMKIGAAGEEAQEVSTGGNSLGFYAISQLRTFNMGELKDGDNIYGSKVMARVVRNKLAPPFTVANLQFNLLNGFDRIHDILSISLQDGVVKKVNEKLQYNDIVLGKNEHEAVHFIHQKPDVLKKINRVCREYHGLVIPEESSGLQLTGS